MNTLTMQSSQNGLITSTNVSENVIRISGFAAHWDEPNYNGEVVSRTSFDKFLNTLKENGHYPALTVYHNGEKVIGRWTLIEAREEGLYVEGEIDCDIAYVANEIAPIILNGTLCGLSTEGFSYKEENSIDKYGNTHIRNFFLTAISIVSVGADLKARFTVSENDMPDNEPEAAEPEEAKANVTVSYFL